MILRYFKNIYVDFAFIFFGIIVISALQGLPNVPAWNEFVTWFGAQLPGNEYSMTEFFGTARSWLITFNTIDISAIARLVDGTGDALNVLRALGFLVNVLAGFLPTVACVLWMGAMGFWYFANNVLPLLFAFMAFFSGDFYSNHLPGVVSQIDWDSMSGQFGYPDQSFVALFLPTLLVG